jgi:triacylglycerol esterase/lipase EstA (alpha/beta hydrolase family)
MDVRHGIAGAICVAVVVAFGAHYPRGASAAYAPVNNAGVALSEPADKLASALSCSPGLDGTVRTPVLLVHGTSLTPEENWSASYQPALNSLRIPWCAVALPDRGTGDVQRNAEYAVHAIREMHRRSGRRIAIIGASQGGMLPRWALRFWPETRAMVDDLVALAPSNHGTTQARVPCRRACFPAHWQQMNISNFMAALNSFQETFSGISYTNIYTRYDEVVRPASSSELHTGDGLITNVSVQEICSLDASDHITMALANATGFHLAMDALSNAGPASTARVARRGCAQPAIPGYNPHASPRWWAATSTTATWARTG